VARAVISEPEVENAKQELRVEKTRQRNAGAPDVETQGGDRRSEAFQVRNKERVTKLKDDASNAHARLRRDRPDIHQRVLGGHLLGRGGNFVSIFGNFVSTQVAIDQRVRHPQRLCGAAPARSAPAQPADLGAEGDGEHQQGEHGDGHGPSVTSNIQMPRLV
jgi:hypothetical protein